AYLATNTETVEKSFGRHVHWGYWETPEQASLTVDEFAQSTENLSKLLIKAANISNGQAILDVGCGFGGTIASLNETYTGLRLVGLNIDERQLDRARQHVHAVVDNTIEFQQGDACALPFPDNSFDAVLAVECIFHFSSREQFFKEAHRVLKPGGYLALSDFIQSGFSPFRLLTQTNSSFFGTCDVRYTKAKYHTLAKASNFVVCVDKNITKNTLPTYKYLKALFIDKYKMQQVTDIMLAFLTTFSIEFISRLHLLSYYIFVFKKPI
ncbi:MAG: class I SAM-dependent methyltransferase, partial [Candidatus Methylumidiphilus sp.]